ncbi:hypothetical protein PAPYR_12061 [Paratrimastix pyriformis]|uniref:Uncharacterized protein n=1 Tax=Paratrimastix pyriformis TaxID=342808 RepID=A0ABQ8U788_9EUKA|nr:hypothetical protein PAPYR_12061 [Paratrimastix pyriformis]
MPRRACSPSKSLASSARAHADLTSRHTALQSERDLLSQDRDTLRAQLATSTEALRTHSASAAQECESLRTQSTSVAQECETLRAQAAASARECEVFRAQARDAEIGQREAEARAEADRAVAQEQIRALTAQLQEARGQHAALSSEQTALQQRYQVLLAERRMDGARGDAEAVKASSPSSQFTSACGGRDTRRGHSPVSSPGASRCPASHSEAALTHRNPGTRLDQTLLFHRHRRHHRHHRHPHPHTRNPGIRLDQTLFEREATAEQLESVQKKAQSLEQAYKRAAEQTARLQDDLTASQAQLRTLAVELERARTNDGLTAQTMTALSAALEEHKVRPRPPSAPSLR